METATKKRDRDQSTRQEIRTSRERTESEEGKDGQDKGRALHADRVEVERRVKKVVGSKAAGNWGETGLVGDPILQKRAG